MLPEKVRIINNPADYPIRFLDASNAVVAPGSAISFDIRGFGATKLAHLTDVQATRGLEFKLNKWNLTAANVTVSGPVPDKTRVKFGIEIESAVKDGQSERQSFYEPGQTYWYNITIGSTDTANTILAKLHNAINLTGAGNGRDFVLKAVGTGTVTGGIASTLTELDFELQYRGYFIKSFSVYNSDRTTSDYVSIAPTETVPYTEGKGKGSTLEFKEKFIMFNNTPYLGDFKEMPREDEYYTEFSWTFKVNRPDPKASDLSEVVRSVIYMNENSCGTEIQNLATFFDQYANTVFSANVAGGSSGGTALWTDGTDSYDTGVNLAEFIANA